MITYLIDGNNLIGKIKSLSRIQNKNQSSREKIAFMLDNYFHRKKANVYLHLDGFPSEAVKTSVIRIIYSEKKTADDKIKEQIAQTSNKKNITVVTSDFNLSEFARVCSCSVISSESFAKQIQKSADDEEQKRIDSMSKEEFKKLFGA